MFIKKCGELGITNPKFFVRSLECLEVTVQWPVVDTTIQWPVPDPDGVD